MFRLGEHGQQAGRDERRIRGGADQIQLAADLESRRGRVRLPQLASEDVTADSLRQWCLARPSAVEEFPFGPEASVFKVGGKMFALMALDARPLTVSLKCEPSLAEALRAEHSAVRPGYHLNKRHWITVTLDNSLPDELVFGLLEDSYELVVDGLPKRERDRVRLSANR